MKRKALSGITAALVMTASWSFGQTVEDREAPNAFPQVSSRQEGNLPEGYRLTVELLTKEALSTAEALCRTGKYAEAAYLLNKVLQLNPNNRAIQQTLARIRRSCREVQAMADLQAFLQRWRQQTQQQEWTSATTPAVSRAACMSPGGCHREKVGLIPTMPTAHPKDENAECENRRAESGCQGRASCCPQQVNAHQESSGCSCCCRCCPEQTTVIAGPVARRHRIVFVPEELLRACPALQRQCAVAVERPRTCCRRQPQVQAPHVIVIAVPHSMPHTQSAPDVPRREWTGQRRAAIAPVGFSPPPACAKVIRLAVPQPHPPTPRVGGRDVPTFIILVPVTTHRTENR